MTAQSARRFAEGVKGPAKAAGLAGLAGPVGPVEVERMAVAVAGKMESAEAGSGADTP